MSNNEMKLVDVINFAVKIEKESEEFYRNAAALNSLNRVKTLLEELRDEEVKHGDRLKSLVDYKGEEITVNPIGVDILIENSSISSDASEKDVLTTALEREKATRDFYGSIATLTNIDSSIVDTFNMLFDQESGHVTKVSNMLKKL